MPSDAWQGRAMDSPQRNTTATDRSRKRDRTPPSGAVQARTPTPGIPVNGSHAVQTSFHLVSLGFFISGGS